MTRADRPRLRAGQLVELVLTYLYEHTDLDLDLTAYELARILGRSSGGVHKVLVRQAEIGTVIRSSSDPARYRISPTFIPR